MAIKRADEEETLRKDHREKVRRNSAKGSQKERDLLFGGYKGASQHGEDGKETDEERRTRKLAKNLGLGVKGVAEATESELARSNHRKKSKKKNKSFHVKEDVDAKARGLLFGGHKQSEEGHQSQRKLADTLGVGMQAAERAQGSATRPQGSPSVRDPDDVIPMYVGELV
jgi:hypothetical protein